MKKPIQESYRRVTDNSRDFDQRFWQAQGDVAIFEAVSEMIRDYLMLRGQNADKLRIQRTVESFRKHDFIVEINSSGRPQDLLDAARLEEAGSGEDE